MKVSVIVPVYNVEKYVERCLRSITNQTLSDIEIIVLNDGSTDNSEGIIKNFIKKDHRIRYFFHDNKGLGLTRNEGIMYSKGEYLAFVDSDDYIEPNMLEILYKAAIGSEAEVVYCETNLIKDKGKEKVRYCIQNKEKVLDSSEEKNKFFLEAFIKEEYSCNAWDKLYNTKFIKNNNIVFGDNKRIFAEDLFFQFQVVKYIHKISFIAIPLYNYYVRSDSIMNTYKENLVKRHIKMFEDLNVFKINEEFEDIYNIFFLKTAILSAINVTSNKYPYTDLLSDIKILGENMYFQNSVVKVLKNKIFKRYIGWKSFYIFFVSKLFLKKKYKVISGFLYCLYYIKNILC
ncbi:Glycosyltransferase involved in cell wall bisynthesis [Eubacterium maltosivorans]|uniref:glycosyltransferase family 2 protein n=1 Tax=Eubacterium maltosivorans TaxID=2041044 RepID=UPI0008860ABA|nr:glycosyltransferase family 2 protein [Eubacterium maltosivorans]WPK80047.1 Putative glycosyltransferase EpsH [Eubacterium maltosivorans]SDP86498.1 Glycosyltransferase involved in cell wall bisynthesis [Eubacterium maltosivorans]